MLARDLGRALTAGGVVGAPNTPSNCSAAMTASTCVFAMQSYSQIAAVRPAIRRRSPRVCSPPFLVGLPKRAIFRRINRCVDRGPVGANTESQRYETRRVTFRRAVLLHRLLSPRSKPLSSSCPTATGFFCMPINKHMGVCLQNIR